MMSQQWALALQQQINETVAEAIHEQFCEGDALAGTQAERYNQEMLNIISRIQRSPTKHEKHMQTVQFLLPHCRCSL
jgi:hypothetical protein